MAKQFLHAAQVARRLEDVAGEAVAQQVWMHALEQALALRELALVGSRPPGKISVRMNLMNRAVSNVSFLPRALRS